MKSILDEHTVYKLGLMVGFINPTLTKVNFNNTTHVKALTDLVNIVEDYAKKQVEETKKSQFPVPTEEKPVWVIINNTDLNEGRGIQFIQMTCEKEITARRLAKGAGIQGHDAEVIETKAYKINNLSWWFAPCRIVEPTTFDLYQEEEERAQAEAKKELELVRQRARDLGLSEEDLKILQSK